MVSPEELERIAKGCKGIPDPGYQDGIRPADGDEYSLVRVGKGFGERDL
jgi:hypothetical protein